MGFTGIGATALETKVMGVEDTAPYCFDVARHPLKPYDLPRASTLTEHSALALATLLPVLGCGEEAASVAFDGLAACPLRGAVVAATLHTIADEERVHDALIRHMQDMLPIVPRDAAILKAAQRFHVGLARGGPTVHLARIAALDSAVCTVLGRLLRPGAPLGDDAVIAPILRRIHRDETQHVRVSRTLTLDHGVDRTLRDAAANARAALADVLALVGDAFEALCIDPALLDRDLRRLPDGLLTA